MLRFFKDAYFFSKVGIHLQNDFGVPGQVFSRPNSFVRQLVRTCRESSLTPAETAYLLIEAREIDRDVAAQFSHFGQSLGFSAKMARRAIPLADSGHASIQRLEEIASRRLVYTIVDAARVVEPDWRKDDPQWKEWFSVLRERRELCQRSWSDYNKLGWTFLGQYVSSLDRSAGDSRASDKSTTP